MSVNNGAYLSTQVLNSNLIQIISAEFVIPVVDLCPENEYFNFLPVPALWVRKDGAACASDAQELVFDLYCAALDTLTLGRAMHSDNYRNLRGRRIMRWCDVCALLQLDYRLPGKYVFGNRMHAVELWAVRSISASDSATHQITKNQLYAWQAWAQACELYGNLYSYLESLDTLDLEGGESAWYPGGCFQLIEHVYAKVVADWEVLKLMALTPIEELPLVAAAREEMSKEAQVLLRMRLEGQCMGLGEL